jgi:hypothetical protein
MCVCINLMAMLFREQVENVCVSKKPVDQRKYRNFGCKELSFSAGWCCGNVFESIHKYDLFFFGF